MSRVTGFMLTGADLKYMVDNEGFRAKNYAALTGDQCWTKQDMETYMYVYIPDSYASNQLAPYNTVLKGLYVTPTGFSGFGSGAGNGNLTIESLNAWTASDDQSWLSLDQTSGTGTDIILVSWVENFTTSLRTGNVTITNTVTGQQIVVVVTQAAATGIPVTQVTVSGGGISLSDACSRYPSFNTNLWIPEGETWNTATNLYNNSLGTSIAPAGYYASDTYARHWNGTTFDANQTCF